MGKLRLGLIQAQASYGENTYIPFAVGCMWATARQYPEIRECWDDPIFVYRKEPIDKALAVLGYPLPDVVAFSNYCWSRRD